MIYILTGPIRSGKTSALRTWAEGRTDVDGLLSPDDASSGTRYFYEIGTGHSFSFEATDAYMGATISVGPFRFLKAAFERANRYLKRSVTETNNTYIVLDELGKLELKGQGLHEAALFLIPQFQELEQRHLVLVVRDTLVEAITEQYQIDPFRLLKKEELKGLAD